MLPASHENSTRSTGCFGEAPLDYDHLIQNKAVEAAVADKEINRDEGNFP